MPRLGLVGFHLRTGVAPVVAAIAVVAYGAALLSDGSPWVGDALWGVQRLGTPLNILLVALAMLSAMDAAAPGSGVRATFEAVPAQSPPLTLAVRWLLAAGPMLVVHVLAVATVVVLSATSSRRVSIPVPTIALQAGAIVLAVMVGIAVAYYVSSILAVAVAGALEALLVFSTQEDLTAVSAGDSPYAGLTVRSDALFASLVAVLVAATLLGLVRLAARRRAQPRAPLAPAVLAVAVLGLGSLAVSGYTIEPDGRTADVCSDTRPRVCVFPEYRRLETRLAFAFEGMAASAVKAGLPEQVLPGTVVQVTPGGPAPERGTTDFLLQFDELAGDRLDPFTVASGLVTPDWCAQLSAPSPPPDAYFERQSDAVAWFIHTAGQMSTSEYHSVAPGISALPPEKQVAVVADTLRRFARCDLG